MLSVQSGGVLLTAKAIRIKHKGAEVTARSIKIMRGGQLVVAYSTTAALSVDAKRSPAAGLSTDSTVLTSSVTAAVAGGTGPFTYAWAYLEHSGGNQPTATDPNFATTQFQQTGAIRGDTTEATFVCTVTDSLGASGTCFVSATFTYTTDGSGEPLL